MSTDTTTPHQEFAAIIRGLAEYPLPADVLRTLHAARRVAQAAEPLPVPFEAAVQRATTWGDLAGLVQMLEASE